MARHVNKLPHTWHSRGRVREAHGGGTVARAGLCLGHGGTGPHGPGMCLGRARPALGAGTPDAVPPP